MTDNEDLDRAVDALHGPGAAEALDKAYADGSLFAQTTPSEGDVDYSALMGVINEYREMVAACVNGLKADGFTDREARRLTTQVLTAQIDDKDEE